MADLEFVDPVSGLPSGTYAYGVVPAGTASTAFATRCRFLDGQTGSVLWSKALVLEVSDDGGTTWRAAVAEITAAITAIYNPLLDAHYAERVRTLGRGTRWPIAALWAGCGFDLALTFTPDLRPGAATQSYWFRVGVSTDPFILLPFVPDAPSGIRTGLGCLTASECVFAPTLTLDTDKITMGDSSYVVTGIRQDLAGADVTLSQDDGASAALASGEEYIAIVTIGASGRTTTKGLKDVAGTATNPAIPAGEFLESITRVPEGGVIVASELASVSGRCAVVEGAGLFVVVQPGRAELPGVLVEPPIPQTVGLTDDATSIVRMNGDGVANDVEGVPLAQITMAAGVLVPPIVDLRRFLDLVPIRISIPGNEAVADARAAVYIPHGWAVDHAEAQARVASTGATGTTDLELELDGTPFATASVAAQANSGAFAFTSTSGAAGWVTVDFTAITAGGARAADFEVVLWTARVG